MKRIKVLVLALTSLVLASLGVVIILHPITAIDSLVLNDCIGAISISFGFVYCVHNLNQLGK